MNRLYMVDYEYYDSNDNPKWQPSGYLFVQTELGITVTGDDRDDIGFADDPLEEIEWMTGSVGFRKIELTYIGEV